MKVIQSETKIRTGKRILDQDEHSRYKQRMENATPTSQVRNQIELGTSKHEVKRAKGVKVRSNLEKNLTRDDGVKRSH